VGSNQVIEWTGVGLVNISLATDGINFDNPIATGIISRSLIIRVPHLPTRFARIQITRPSPLSMAVTDSFFTIDATITLAKFDATSGEGATRLSWETRPGPEADIRYRIERSIAGASFLPIADALDRGEFIDSSPTTSSRYRLIAINGLGEEYVLGETSVAPALSEGRLLAVSPNPSVGGNVSIAFRTAQAGQQTDLSIYDASGRRVRTLASESFALGVRSIAWDGRDEAGASVAAGAYFARLTWNGVANATERVTIVR
jgi:hypothetical protein